MHNANRRAEGVRDIAPQAVHAPRLMTGHIHPGTEGKRPGELISALSTGRFGDGLIGNFSCISHPLSARYLLYLGGMEIARSSDVSTDFTHTDHLGSPVAQTSWAGGLNWREDYTPYGETRQNPTGNRDSTGFTGHIQDNVTGLTYMQARFYDPVVGRFLSSDPVGFATGGVGYFNRYAYVQNDPINATDPTGMCTGSRIKNSDSTCASTGGFTTDVVGAAQGMSKVTVVGAVSVSAIRHSGTAAHPRQGEPDVRELEGSYFSEGPYTEKEAAAQLVRMMNAEPFAVEFAALILKRGSAYSYSDAVTSFDRYTVSPAAVEILIRGMGTWAQLITGNTVHTHPTNPNLGTRYLPRPGMKGDSPGDWIAGPNGCLYKLTAEKFFSGGC